MNFEKLENKYRVEKCSAFRKLLSATTRKGAAGRFFWIGSG
jgi:hypothetical protein